MTRLRRNIEVLLVLLFLSTSALSAQQEPETRQLIERLVQVLQDKEGDAAREGPLADLLQDAEQLRTDHPDSALAWLAVARIRFWYADTQSIGKGLAGMKAVRDELEQAIVLDANGNGGMAQAFLGYVEQLLERKPQLSIEEGFLLQGAKNQLAGR